MRLIQRLSCPGCRSNEWAVLYQVPYKDLFGFFEKAKNFKSQPYLVHEYYTLHQCAACRLIYQANIPDDDMLAAIYGEWGDTEQYRVNHIENVKLETRLVMMREVTTLISYFRKEPSDLSLFDFGMGWGEWCFVARALGCKIRGAELSKERIEFVEQNGIETVSWNEIPNAQFDFINAEQVFEHLAHPVETLAHLKRGLASKGLLRISVPNARAVEGKLKDIPWDDLPLNGGRYNAVAPLQHLNTFSHASLVALGEKCGLRPVKIPLRARFRTFISRPSIRGNLDLLLRMTPYAQNRSTIIHFTT